MSTNAVTKFIVNTTDLSGVFLPLSIGTSITGTTGFISNSNDLSNIFAKYIYGTNTNISGNTKFVVNNSNFSNKDLNVVFQPYKNFSNYTILNASTGYTNTAYSYWTSGCSISQTGQYAVIASFSAPNETGPGAVYYTNNYGVSWTISTGFPTSNFFPRGIKITPDGLYCILVNTYGGVNEDVYFSSNYGASFTKTTNYLPTTYFMNNLVISNNGQKVIVVGPNNTDIYSSSNSGNTWSTINISGSSLLNFNNICTESTFTTFYMTSNNGIYKSTNGGSSWSSISGSFGIPSISSLPTWNGCAMSTDGVRIVLASYGGAIYFSTNSGSSFLTINSLPTSGLWYAAAITYDGSAIAVGLINSNILYISYNSGTTWITYNSSISSSYYVDTIAIQNKLLLVTTISKVFYSYQGLVYKSSY